MGVASTYIEPVEKGPEINTESSRLERLEAKLDTIWSEIFKDKDGDRVTLSGKLQELLVDSGKSTFLTPWQIRTTNKQ
jgi:hypothetical protein